MQDDVQNGHPCTASATDVKIQVVIFTALFYFIGNSIGKDILVEVLVVFTLFLK